ncbi:hypothetical protein F4W70_09280 [Pseudomonas cannabina]|nr:hypothetical protein F4W70_09280 [Pseudomonas cannabina]
MFAKGPVHPPKMHRLKHCRRGQAKRRPVHSHSSSQKHDAPTAFGQKPARPILRALHDVCITPSAPTWEHRASHDSYRTIAPSR